MKTLKNVPIFSVGKWNQMKFSESDLQDMADNFAKLKDIHKVPLKLGHNNDQKITDGQPALGWVQNVRRVGAKLLADFINVPDVLAKAIQNKLYRTVSIELLMGVKRGKDTLRHVLDAVAILGADQPAVNNLGDLDQFLATRSVDFDDEGSRVVFETEAGNLKSTNTGDPEMDEKEVKKLIAEAIAAFAKANPPGMTAEERAEFDRITKENAELKAKLEAANADKKKFESEQATKKITEARAAVKAIFEAAVTAKALSPAQRDAQMKLFKVEDDAAVVAIDQGELKKAFGVEKVTPKEGSEGMNNTKDQNRDESPFVEAENRIRKFRAENPKSTYGEAMTAVFRADPEFHREYLDATPPEQFHMAGGAN